MNEDKKVYTPPPVENVVGREPVAWLSESTIEKGRFWLADPKDHKSNTPNWTDAFPVYRVPQDDVEPSVYAHEMLLEAFKDYMSAVDRMTMADKDTLSDAYGEMVKADERARLAIAKAEAGR